MRFFHKDTTAYSCFFFLSSFSEASKSDGDALWICFRIVSEKIPSRYSFLYSNNFLLCVNSSGFSVRMVLMMISMRIFFLFSHSSFVQFLPHSLTHSHDSFVYHSIIIIILVHFSQLLFITEMPPSLPSECVWTRNVFCSIDDMCVRLVSGYKTLIACHILLHIPGNRYYFDFFLLLCRSRRRLLSGDVSGALNNKGFPC